MPFVFYFFCMYAFILMQEQSLFIQLYFDEGNKQKFAGIRISINCFLCSLPNGIILQMEFLASYNTQKLKKMKFMHPSIDHFSSVHQSSAWIKKKRLTLWVCNLLTVLGCLIFKFKVLLYFQSLKGRFLREIMTLAYIVWQDSTF